MGKKTENQENEREAEDVCTQCTLMESVVAVEALRSTSAALKEALSLPTKKERRKRVMKIAEVVVDYVPTDPQVTDELLDMLDAEHLIRLGAFLLSAPTK